MNNKDNENLVKQLFQKYAYTEIKKYASLHPLTKKIIENAFNAGMVIALQQSEMLNEHIFLGRNAEILKKMEENTGIFTLSSDDKISAEKITNDLEAYNFVKHRYDSLVSSSKQYEIDNNCQWVRNAIDLDETNDLTMQ